VEAWVEGVGRLGATVERRKKKPFVG
jgi:hypothetical protein